VKLDEAIKTAIDYESRVHRVYVEAEREATSEVGKRVFRTLREEERQHLEYLRERLREWTESGRVNVVKLTTSIPTREAINREVSKLRAAVAQETNENLDKEVEALKRALEVEDETSRFYEEMVRTLDAEGQALFRGFVEVEQGHKAIVQAEIDCVTGSGYWFDMAEIRLEMG